jgi:hypothetical protein
MSPFRNPLVLALLACAAMPFPAAAEAPLTNVEISRHIIGRDLTAQRAGMDLRIRYDPDGSVRMRILLVSGSGTWRFADDGLCVDMTSGPKRGRACTTFERVGDKTFRNSQGLILKVRD